MISGRGLGHSGGTLDKIGSIPGYNPFPDVALLRKVVKSAGCAIIGQTSDLAPADRRLYSIRDVTGTVESVPLITASILSKKMAAGLDALVMDVKAGNAAFMSTVEKAETLAKSIIGTAKGAGLPTHALITDMNQNLGETAGNAVELVEAVQYLTDEHREARLDEVCISLVAEMQVAGGIESDHDAARRRVVQAITSGAAAETFSKMIAALGGPADFVENYRRYLPEANIQAPVSATAAGYVAAVDGRKLGNAIIEMGGGRRYIDDQLDLSVGFSDIAPVGAEVGPERPLAIVHAADDDSAAIASQMLRDACTVSAQPPADTPVIYATLTAD